MNREAVERTFPELRSVEDDSLRGGVIGAWVAACVDAGIDDAGELAAVPWYPPLQLELGIPSEAETLVDHSRDVTAGALALADAVAARDGLDRDLLVAAALVHDVSKLVEFDGLGETTVGSLLGHPYYGVHLIERSGLPTECAHVVLSHSDRTSLEPAFLEAELIKRADQAATEAVRERWADGG
jgi:putative nucleotidyltransferase with HDIG domain